MSVEAKKPIASPSLVLREEFDDWAILFDPDRGNAFGLNPVGVFIWKHLDGEHSLEDILGKLLEVCENVPGEALEDLREFTDGLVERGFVGYEVQKAQK